MYKINEKTCADCGYCAYVCPFGAIEHDVDGKFYFINQEKCQKCGICFKSCIGGFISCDKDDQIIKEIHIDEANCIGCSMCSRVCPAQAVSGEIRKAFKINPDLCIKCGVCASKCPKKCIQTTKGSPKK